MKDYKLQAKKLQPRLCTNHDELPYSMGCRNCCSVFCNKCTPALETCANGKLTCLGFVILSVEYILEFNKLILKLAIQTLRFLRISNLSFQ